jgi:hypothetical protein
MSCSGRNHSDGVQTAPNSRKLETSWSEPCFEAESPGPVAKKTNEMTI